MSRKQTRDLLRVALRRMLRQLARMLILAGIRFDEFAELIRGVYIECAARDCDGPRKQSRARIAMLTGLTQAQIDWHLDVVPPSTDVISVDLLVEVLHRWHTTSEYVGPYGIPRELEFDQPPERCFRSLVALAAPNANADAALRELRRAGAVTLVGESRLRALSRSFLVNTAASPQFIEHFGTTLRRFAETMEHNMEPTNVEKRLQRCVRADRGLSVEQVADFEDLASRKAMDFLLELDNWLALHTTEDTEEDERMDAGVNVFLYLEPPGEEPPLAVIGPGAGLLSSDG